MKIGIDIDGVINDLESFHIDYGTKFINENSLPYNPDFGKYKLEDIYGWDKETRNKFYSCFSDVLFMSSRYLRPLVPEVIDILARTNEIFIITARPDNLADYLMLPPGSTTASFTKQWLRCNRISYNHLEFTSEDKLNAIEQNGIELMIEDNPCFLVGAEKAVNIPVFVYHAGYNMHIRGEKLTRVYSWYDILQKTRLLMKNNRGEEK